MYHGIPNKYVCKQTSGDSIPIIQCFNTIKVVHVTLYVFVCTLGASARSSKVLCGPVVIHTLLALASWHCVSEISGSQGVKVIHFTQPSRVCADSSRRQFEPMRVRCGGRVNP